MTDKDEKILNAKLDESELSQVSGGGCLLMGADGGAGCTTNYYLGKCDATVEYHSRCHRHDFCNTSTHIKYQEAPAEACNQHATAS